jgi:Sulfotransferase family
MAMREGSGPTGGERGLPGTSKPLACGPRYTPRAMTATVDSSPDDPSPDDPHPSGKVPDFFIVGNPKSGTTALHHMLRRHPQLYVPDLEGTQFLSGEAPPRSRESDMQVEDYLSLFRAARPEQRVGEVSQSYLRSHTAARRIAALRPDARIIAILREPASFLRSLHLELLQDHVETEKDLGKAIALEEAATRDPLIPQRLGYSQERVQYVEQLRRYHAAFPPEQVLVLIYDDFRADNEGTVRQVLRFLDVDDTSTIEVTEANPTIRIRSVRLHEFVRSLYLGRGPAARVAKRAIKALTPQQLRRDGLQTLRRRVLFGKPHPPDEELMLELRRRSKGEVVALSEYLGRDLVTLWGYDGID